MKKLFFVILLVLNQCMTYDCYTTEFNFNECMEAGYATIINAQSLPENLKNTALLPVLQIYLQCKKKQKEWKDVCPYTILAL